MVGECAWWGCVWRGGGMHGNGRGGFCVAGETTTEAGGTHPTGMHSCGSGVRCPWGCILLYITPKMCVIVFFVISQGQ